MAPPWKHIKRFAALDWKKSQADSQLNSAQLREERRYQFEGTVLEQLLPRGAPQWSEAHDGLEVSRQTSALAGRLTDCLI